MVRRNMQTHGFVDKQRIDSAFVEHPSQLPRPAHAPAACAHTPGPHSPMAGGMVSTHVGSGMNQKFIEQTLAEGGVGASRAPSFVATARGIFQCSGARGFFKGLLLNWIKGPITASISFTTYDIIKNYLDKIVTRSGVTGGSSGV
jgi:hypothetical protein